MANNKDLQQLRHRIDVIDAQLLALIGERAECAMEVARVKRQDGDTHFYRPEREAQVLQKIMDANNTVLDDKEIARLFREIMSACLALEQPLNVAFLGPEGTYTQAAALKHFGHSVNTVPVSAIDEVFREVESGAAHYGVVPVENSTEGVVSYTLDLFTRSTLKICGEVEVRIHHYLLSTAEQIDQIQRIYSHQQSLAQCREWLDSHMPGIERIAVSSNAEATRRAQQEPNCAAVAGKITAELYGLNILAKNIEDEPDNTTRFLVIGKQATQPSGNDKTTLLFSMSNCPGALSAMVAPFGKYNISMTRIESRPSRRGMWDYVFFVDVAGHAQDADLKQALQDIEKEASMVKVLGSYPKVTM